MPNAVSSWWSGLRARARHPESDLPQIGLGLGALLLVVILGAIAAYVYISPPGTKEIRFFARDSVSISKGENVRVAGISVGKVSRVALKKDAVEVTAKIEDSIRLGDASRVEVRLLTAVGGYSVNLIPAGEGNIGSEPIPVARVTVPYTVADTLQALPRVTENVQGAPINEVLDQVSTGFQAQSQSIRKLLSGAQSVTTILDQQRTQVRSILGMVSEYSATFAASRQLLFQTVDKVNTVLSSFYVYRDGFSEAYRQMGLVIRQLAVLSTYYLNHKDEVYAAVRQMQSAAKQMSDGMSGLIDQLEPVVKQLNAAAVPLASTGDARSGFVLDMSNVCIPVGGRTC